MKDTKDAGKSESYSQQHPSLPPEDLLKTLRQKGLSILSGLSKHDMKKIANWAQDVFDDYAATLERLPMKIKNIADLPHSKQDIKMAVKILLMTHLSKGSEDMVELLKEIYVRMSAFQEISRKDQEILLKESRKMDKTNGSVSRPAIIMQDKYIGLIVAEQNVLVDDINAFIEDLPYLA